MAHQQQTKLIVTSTAFGEGETIPSKYTCDGENISLPISWEGIPQNTKSFVIIMDDSDIPIKGISLFTFVHWLAYNIPPGVNSLPEAVPADEMLDNGAKQGLTSLRRIGYTGPCPPFGMHRYHFKVYAVDTMIDLEPRKATNKNVLKAIEGHILASGELMGRYKKGG